MGRTGLGVAVLAVGWLVGCGATPASDGDSLGSSSNEVGNPCFGVICGGGDQCNDAVCQGGNCVLRHKQNGTTCNDGSLCTTNDACQAGTCRGTAVTCAAGDQCHVAGTCNPSTGVCSAPAAKPDGTACNDSNACTQSDTCQAGSCVGANPVVCAASDQCHVAGTCNPSTGACSNPPVVDGTFCNDGNACTQVDTCRTGTCVGAAPVVCAPFDQCHAAGTCDPSSGACTNPPVADGTACNDGNACTQSDSCQAGSCVGANPVTCVAADQCHVAGSCDPSSGVCSNPPIADGTSCNDGSACTQTDTCQSGSCIGGNPVVCVASDQCHVPGTCDPSNGACSNPAAPNGTSCADGNACTQTDTCQAGACVGSNPVVCSALDQCHVAGSCDPSSGTCSNPNAPNGTSCNDGNLCTQSDSCQTGSCVGSNPVVCSALDQCHVAGTCDPSNGTCNNPNAANGTSCNDGNACSQTDTCQTGACVGSNPVVCTALDQCHVAGTCDPSNGVCSNPNAADGTGCTDGDACTQTDTCQTGACVGANPVVCTALDQCHVAGSCDPSSGTCSNPNAANGTSCNDGNLCTQTDSCQTGSCVGSNPVVCTALDQCHVAGTCDPSKGTCSNPNAANGTACNDGDACSRTDTCQTGACVGGNFVVCTALDQCHVAGTCDPANGVCSNPNVADGTGCTDGNACTQTDTCQTGACVGANPVVCTALDQCHVAGTCNSATGSCSNPNAADGIACNDNDACSQTDTCQTGTCVGGNFVVCTALDQCHVVGTCDSSTGVCSQPAAPDDTPCSDGDACTLLDTCQTGACIAGLPVVCTALDQCHVAGTCDSATGVCSDPTQPDATPCDDGQDCTTFDQCTAGVCGGLSSVNGTNGIATRDPGFYKTHPDMLEECLAQGDIDVGVATVSTVDDALGVLWANTAHFASGQHRSVHDKDSLKLAAELLAARCNLRLFGATTPEICAASTAYYGTDCASVQSMEQTLASFNQSGAGLALPSGMDAGSADPKAGRAAVDPTSPSGWACTNGP